MTGTPKVAPSACITCGGSEAEDERISRSRARATASALRGARARIAWCMVGTAVYQVGSAASSQPKKRSASKPGLHQTEPPAARLDATAATRPWMWKSGITFRQRSSGVSASAAPMCRAEAAMFACVSGTIFGREVVPEVCRISATRSGRIVPISRTTTPGGRSDVSLKLPAGAPGSTSSRSTGTPSAVAASSATPA